MPENEMPDIVNTSPTSPALELVDSHLHLSQGYADLSNTNYQQRIESKLGLLCKKQNIEQLHLEQLALAEYLSALIVANPQLKLHVQSVSYVDSVFNYALLTHPLLRPYLNQNLFLYIGIHPWFMAPELNAALQELDLLLDLLEQPHIKQVVRGIGEIGLDKSERAIAELAVQQKVLQKLLEYNQQHHGLPVSLHCLKAHNELLRILSKVYPKVESLSSNLSPSLNSSLLGSRGTVHGFNSSVDMAQKYVRLGFKLGLGLTWSRPEKLSKLRQLLQLGRQDFCCETDFDQQFYQVEPLQALASYIADCQN